MTPAALQASPRILANVYTQTSSPLAHFDDTSTISWSLPLLPRQSCFSLLRILLVVVSSHLSRPRNLSFPSYSNGPPRPSAWHSPSSSHRAVLPTNDPITEFHYTTLYILHRNILGGKSHLLGSVKALEGCQLHRQPLSGCERHDPSVSSHISSKIRRGREPKALSILHCKRLVEASPPSMCFDCG